MQRDAFLAGIIVLLFGVVLIPISQVLVTEIRDRLVVDQTVQIPEGDTSFEVNLESNTLYELSIKGGLITSDNLVRVDVLTPDSSSLNIDIPVEDPKSELQTGSKWLL